MSGISLRLRRLLIPETLSSTLTAYLYAGMISAGPLVLSIVGILLVGLLSLSAVRRPEHLVQFQVSVTYLIAASLIVTGLVQLAFTRYVSDRMFERQLDRILSSYHAISLVTTAAAGVLGVLISWAYFGGLSMVYRMLMVMAFVILSHIWVASTFLASIKQYGSILLAFFFGYGLTVLGAVWLAKHGLNGLLAGFVAGQAILLMVMNGAIHRRFRSERYVSWDMFSYRRAYPILIGVGFLFNLGVWLDKFMFWFAATGTNIIGPLRASVIYDMPIFISYLCIIPGIAVFLLRMETDFADHYNEYYGAVRDGGTLDDIRRSRDEMVYSARAALYEILKIQTVVALLVYGFGESVLEYIGISRLYLPLLRIDVVAASLQILFLGVLNIFFYLDKRRLVLVLTLLFVVLNGTLTWATLQLGPSAYGYGFVVALLVTVVLGFYLLDRHFEALEYDTYMAQGGG
ncbi:exopolysaccharide Pel transporter PelG [Pollutimonas sp. M17]|jgi:uncharacterized membrane protein|uniref:exopolysaccharide Pel transporter PelG n=1 Tax=Pollutimonas sp. M17 TaxID=2962065 RepID=UPI0021F49E52|nr:exopolysaccharide Pel transporter PelG [Pollutimonas sp. M17]UYO93588.1 exopolysaccharide Pel transporter PelG [Pollutimonas sp. M17]